MSAPAPTPEDQARDLFDATVLPDLPDTPPEIIAALRDMYVAGYLQAQTHIQALEQALAAAAFTLPATE